MSRKEGTKNLKNSTTGKGNVLVPYVLVFIVAFLRVELVNSLNVVPVFSCLLFFAASRPASRVCSSALTTRGSGCFFDDVPLWLSTDRRCRRGPGCGIYSNVSGVRTFADLTKLGSGCRVLPSGVCVVLPREQLRRLGCLADVSQEPCGPGCLLRGRPSVLPQQRDFRTLLQPADIWPGGPSAVVDGGESHAESGLLENSTL